MLSRDTQADNRVKKHQSDTGTLVSACLKGATVSHEYTSSIFTGFAVELPDLHAGSRYSEGQALLLDCLLDIPSVVNVRHSPTYHLSSDGQPAPGPSVPEGPQLMGGEGLLSASSRALHQTTGVDVLHSQGVNGTGVTVALVDDGVDYLHPALGGGLGPGFTVAHGRDMTGGGGTGYNASDPFSDCEHHGTHVAGIIAGHDPSVGYVGAAPGARLDVYRVLGCGRNGSAGAMLAGPVLEAVLAAYDRGVDVISMSLGFVSGPFPHDPVSELLQRIAEEGKTVPVVSVGNWGWQGAFSGTAPAAASGVLSVGCAVGPGSQQTWPRAHFEVGGPPGGGGGGDFAWSVVGPSRFPGSAPLCALTLDPLVYGDGCSQARDEEGPTVSSSYLPSQCVVLVRRGGCKISVKMETVRRAGGRYVLVYDNTTAETPFRTQNSFDGILGAGTVSAKTGEHFIGLLASGYEVQLHMDSEFTSMPYATAFDEDDPPVLRGAATPHTTWGPSGNMALMPSVLAPGTNILSTVPRSFGGYGVLGGSSMATPYAAACVALVRQAHPGIKAAEIIRRVATTAAPLLFSDGGEDPGAYGFLAPAWQQGGGQLDCLAAVRAATVVDPGALSLNDTEFFRGAHRLTVTNTGGRPLGYQLLHRPATSLLPLRQHHGRTVVEPFNKVWTDSGATPGFLSALTPDLHARVSIEPATFTLAPNMSRTVLVKVHVEGVFNDSLQARCPLYSGFVQIQAEDGYDLAVPYGGIACRMRNVPVLPASLASADTTFLAAATKGQTDHGNPYAPFAGKVAEPGAVFHVPGPAGEKQQEIPDLGGGASAAEDPTLFPTVSIQLAMFSRQVTVDVVPVSPSTATAGGDGDGPPQGEGWPAFSVLDDLATPLADGFSRAVPRWIRWTGRLGNGTWVPQGRYCFRVCALRMWEDAAVPDAVRDCVVTAPFDLRYETQRAAKSAFLCDLDDLLQSSIWET